MNYREFWQHDYHIIGIHKITSDGECGCGNLNCKIAGKHPIAKGWQHSPVWSEEQINTMDELGQFSTGYGVLMQGLFVIDVDARNGGMESLSKLIERFPEIIGSGLIVETGSGEGSRHYYFSIDDPEPLVTHSQDYPGIDFKSSGYVVGPGSQHRSGNKYTVLSGSVSDISAIPPSLVSFLKKPEKIRTEYDGQPIDISNQLISDMLNYIEADEYELWIRIGMSIHEVTGGTGFLLWDTWSRNSKKYKQDEMDYKWHSFGKSSTVVKFGTLAHHALVGGWSFPVEFESSEIFETEQTNYEYPVDISGIDLLRPPGFIGEVARWIDQQGYRPRERLSIAGALTAIGNIIGLRTIDEWSGVTSNLFSFCVGGSGTGKEACQQAIYEIHRVAGMSPACHGSIKSEQEIMRNIAIRHQASFYLIDELGILLQKLKSAQDKGGAIYLEGVIGLLMSAYSKADGYLPITGDLREEIKSILKKEIDKQKRLLSENDPDYQQEKHDKLKDQLYKLDMGIYRPFVSIIGFTTPETFYSLVDKSSVTNGFIGRSLLFVEGETVPRFREDHVKPDMPETMQNTLIQLAQNGYFSMLPERIEFYGDRYKVPSTNEAADALKLIRRWLDDQAYEHKELSGLEAMYLRCYELVLKVSFILAAPSGLRELIHVAWAFKLICSDIEIKTNIVESNDSVLEKALAARIMTVIGDGQTEGVIVNGCRKWKKQDVLKCLLLMEKNKMIEGERRKVKKGKETISYTRLQGTIYK